MVKFKLIILLGPTAIGKTEMAIRLASRLQCDVISADSRQIYKEMTIGTAKPSLVEQRGVNHHLLDFKSIHDYYSAGRYEQDVIELIDLLSGSHDKAIMAGGSGLYIQAICQGIDEMPDPDPEIRNRLEMRLNTEGLDALTDDLKKLDPESWEDLDLKNPKRVMRALEVIYQTSEKYSLIKKGKAKSRSFDYLKIGLEMDREMLYRRINQRADQMLEAGLIGEVKKLFRYRQLIALQTVGYQEFFGHLEGKYNLDEAIRLFKRNSRRYAKKQMTWFKKDPEIHWFPPESMEQIAEKIENFLIS
jgi:tRNA dimethylallyltransferase